MWAATGSARGAIGALSLLIPAIAECRHHRSARLTARQRHRNDPGLRASIVLLVKQPTSPCTTSGGSAFRSPGAPASIAPTSSIVERCCTVMAVSMKPASVNNARYSSIVNAPATHPAQSSAARICSSETGNPVRSPSITISETAGRPPGLRTRNASCNACDLSGVRLMTQLEIITSMTFAGSGMFSISPLRNSTLATPAFSALRRATASILSVISTPYTYPPTPTRCAASSASRPPPDPRSSTISPSRSEASATGLPHPNDVVTTPDGSAAITSSPYSAISVGTASPPHPDGEPQHEPD